jgi:hypothetical protein
MHVKCNIGSNTVVDINRNISANYSGIIEVTWKLAPDKITDTNIYINNNRFRCNRTTYIPAFKFDKIATADLTLHGFSGSPASILMTYDVISAEVQILCCAVFKHGDALYTRKDVAIEISGIGATAQKDVISGTLPLR